MSGYDGFDETLAAWKEQDKKRAALTGDKIKAELAKLAALPIGVYESERVAAAKRLKMRAAVLDRLVRAERPTDDGAAAGTAIELVARVPAESPVDGDALLAGIIEQIGTYVFLPPHEKIAVALWVVASHAFDAFFIFPRLRLKSATKGCGKSTLLDVIECLVNKPLIPSNATGPSLFRIIAAQRPTVLLDEADRYMPKNDDLISIVNAGHKKNGTVLRCVGDDQEVRAFSVWAPMAIAAIRSLAGTVEHRAVMIDMQRRPPGQKLKRFRSDRPAKGLDLLTSQAARWAADNQITLGTADPKIPEALSNRAADNWLPLFAVAEAIGGVWPEKARTAATANHHGDDDELGVRLLDDIKAVFAGDAMHSTDLIAALNAREGAPWAEISRGRPLTAAKLSTMLRDFSIHADQIKIGGVNRNGYRRSQFDAAFAAYFAQPPSGNSTSSTALKDMEKMALQDSTSDFPGRVSEHEIPPEQQSGRPGRPSEPPVGANGHAAGPICDYDAAIEALSERAAAHLGTTGEITVRQPATIGAPEHDPVGRRCAYCDRPGTADDPLLGIAIAGEEFTAHRGCAGRERQRREPNPGKESAGAVADDLDEIPAFLRRV